MSNKAAADQFIWKPVSATEFKKNKVIESFYLSILIFFLLLDINSKIKNLKTKHNI